jgi:hypothetical protein
MTNPSSLTTTTRCSRCSCSEKDKREDKEASDKAALDAKKEHAILTHSLRQKTKENDVLRREIAKKKKDAQVSNNVGLIAAGLGNKKMQINNCQFNSHVSLEAASLFSIVFFLFSLLLTFVTRLPQSYETLIGSNASMHSSQQPPAAVHHYQV